MHMTVDELYDHITKQITPEVALRRMIASSLIPYEKLKFDKGETIDPVMIIAMASMDLGWNFLIENNHEDIRGLIVGTEEYMKDNQYIKS